MLKETFFMVIAILIASGEPEEIRHHPGFKFETLKECTDFVQLNYPSLYTGLLMTLAQEGSDQQIQSIACGEYNMDPNHIKAAKLNR